ncbi:MAG: transglutaminase-like domain-containing protein [Candidatus Thorarchaeota archaeon]
MAEELFEVKATPAVLKYMVLISTFAAGLVGIVSYYAAGQEGTATGDFLRYYATVNFSLMAFSAIELGILRKKLTGRRAGIGGLIELYRGAVYLDLPLFSIRNAMNDVGKAEYDVYVGNNLGMQAVGVLGIATLVGLLVSNFAYDRLTALGEKVVFRNAFNAVPAIVLILAYAASMGVFREVLIGPRHQNDVTDASQWNKALFDQYETIIPGWDASELLQNYLNQFLNGLENSDREILRYRDDGPGGNGGAADPTFFRTESFIEYVYNDSIETSAFQRIASIEETNDYPVFQYSSSPPSPDNVFSILYNITYTGDEWSGFIPTSWDTATGNYVDYGSMRVYESDGVTEVDPGSYDITLEEVSTIGVPRAVRATISFDKAGSGYQNCYLGYDVPYKELNIADFYVNALPPDGLYDLYNRQDPVITRFLQLPDTLEDFPDISGVDESDWDEYWDWTNYSATLQSDPAERLLPKEWLYEVIENDSLDAPTTSAMTRAAYVANRIANAFIFDWDMWRQDYTDDILGGNKALAASFSEGERLGPEVGEDFVGWMFNRGHYFATNGSLIPDGKRLGGTAAHFATSLCLMLREMGIPARTVLGYVGTNQDQLSEAIITAMYTHSWVEALIPLDTSNPLDDIADTAEWVIFDADPRANGFYELPSNAATTAETYNVTLEIRDQATQNLWLSSDPIYRNDNLTFYVRVSSTSQGTTTGKPNANVTLGFETLGTGGGSVLDYKLIATNLTTDLSGEVFYDFTYDSSNISKYGAGTARITAYVNNTISWDSTSGTWIAGTPINGTVFSDPYDWRPFPEPSAVSASTAYNPSADGQKEIDDTASWEKLAKLRPYHSQNCQIISLSRLSLEKRFS